ncbi:MAG: major capsid protein [Microviridae sp.]|nr:MAG: major capsid protein [Microviridae sp.]
MKLIRHTHDLSFTHTTSFSPGQLVPVAHLEILPGDTINMKTSALLRCEPLNKPLMHEVEMRIHHWFVPNRILWDGWEDFITGVTAPTTTATRPPVTQTSDPANMEIIDHCGGRPLQNTAYTAFLNRGYNTIWNEFYRDQELQNALTTSQLDTSGKLANINWNKDYFTTARSSPQEGAATTIPLNLDTLPVKGLGISGSNNTRSNITDFQESGTYEARDASGSLSATNDLFYETVSQTAPAVSPYYPNIRVDTADLGLGITIDTLRQAMATQRVLEARSLFGTRYTDYLAYYGVKSSDARLQRPEYLGGFTKRIHFSEVLNTGASTGDLFGHGIAHKSGGRFRKMFEEHGHLFSLMSVRPLATYQQGRPRKFNRQTPFDYWTREFENTPWQEIKLSELFSVATNSDDPHRSGTTFTGDPTFGYTSRFDEYRESPNIVSGALRRTDTTVVDADKSNYTWGRYFKDSLIPSTVDGVFTECKPTTEIFQSALTDPFIVHLNHSIKAKRLVSTNARIMHAL